MVILAISEIISLAWASEGKVSRLAYGVKAAVEFVQRLGKAFQGRAMRCLVLAVRPVGLLLPDERPALRHRLNLLGRRQGVDALSIDRNALKARLAIATTERPFYTNPACIDLKNG
jgi:hypothetical protein